MKRPSIRKRLLVWTMAVTSIVLLVTGVLLYSYFKRTFYGQYDKLLNEAATVAMIEVEVEDSKVHHEWKESLEEQSWTNDETFIQVWDFNSRETVKSKALGQFDLQANYGEVGERVFYNITLPNGETGRAVGILMLPRLENEGGNDGFIVSDHPQIFVWAESLEELESVLSHACWTFVGGGLFILALLWGAISVIIGFSARPVLNVMNEIINREGSEIGSELSIPNSLPSEIAGLAKRFNGLLLKIDEFRQKDRDFFLNIAHEIRTPLAGVHAINEQALRKPREQEDYRRRFEEAFAETRALNTLVTRLMRFGQIRRSENVLELETVDCHALLQRVWLAFQQRAYERSIGIQWQLCEDAHISTDIGLLKVIVSNLIENAINYATEESIVHIKTSCHDNSVSISIENSITHLDLEDGEESKFFESFYRADKARDQEGNHAGLGLSFSLEIAKALGGDISVSHPDSDSLIFEIVIPNRTIAQ